MSLSGEQATPSSTICLQFMEAYLKKITLTIQILELLDLSPFILHHGSEAMAQLSTMTVIIIDMIIETPMF